MEHTMTVRLSFTSDSNDVPSIQVMEEMIYDQLDGQLDDNNLRIKTVEVI